ncbi:hypothetical protein [Dactylosporangium sp. CA-139066]|uniref:hypothetical protein n=1 Tax=Dactylosporangium sp. CA-139066 TaxID=3239930 RepID=UPI003D8FA58A
MPNARPTAAGLALAALLALAAACGDEPAPAAAPPAATNQTPANADQTPTKTLPSPTAEPSPTGKAVNKAVSYMIVKRRASPPTGRVEVGRGEVISITVTSDEADELHVHGYDKELALKAGEPASLTLTADRTGLFEVETHKSHLVLFQLVVR